MFEKRRILALVPARGGSKGIKDKNIRELCGLPLIAHTINAAKQSKYIDNLVVTTDSEKIADIAKKYGASVPFLRPIELADDNSKTIDAVVHAIQKLSEKDLVYDVLVLLQPTQPLRTAQNIDEAIELFFAHNCQSVVSVCLVNDHPLLMRTINENMRLRKFMDQSSTVRRQDFPNYYVVNGAIYVNLVSDIALETSLNDNDIGYIMDKKNSIDIDDMLDFYFAETMITINS